MIRGVCSTRLDGYEKATWPTEFAFPPRIGDRVESVDRTHVLTIVGVTHTTDAGGRMLVRVELHR